MKVHVSGQLDPVTVLRIKPKPSIFNDTSEAKSPLSSQTDGRALRERLRERLTSDAQPNLTAIGTIKGLKEIQRLQAGVGEIDSGKLQAVPSGNLPL